MKQILKYILAVPKYLALSVVKLFQFCISPFIPHTCKFTPTCSVYASACLHEWGFLVGVKLTIIRLFKCSPFTHGGLDAVPINPKKYYKNIM